MMIASLADDARGHSFPDPDSKMVFWVETLSAWRFWVQPTFQRQKLPLRRWTAKKRPSQIVSGDAIARRNVTQSQLQKWSACLNRRSL